MWACAQISTRLGVCGGAAPRRAAHDDVASQRIAVSSSGAVISRGESGSRGALTARAHLLLRQRARGGVRASGAEDDVHFAVTRIDYARGVLRRGLKRYAPLLAPDDVHVRRADRHPDRADRAPVPPAEHVRERARAFCPRRRPVSDGTGLDDQPRRLTASYVLDGAAHGVHHDHGSSPRPSTSPFSTRTTARRLRAAPRGADAAAGGGSRRSCSSAGAATSTTPTARASRRRAARTWSSASRSPRRSRRTSSESSPSTTRRATRRRRRPPGRWGRTRQRHVHDLHGVVGVDRGARHYEPVRVRTYCIRVCAYCVGWGRPRYNACEFVAVTACHVTVRPWYRDPKHAKARPIAR